MAKIYHFEIKRNNPAGLVSFEFSNCAYAEPQMANLKKIICAFLCIAISELLERIQANPTSPPAPAEDLQDEYYNVIPAKTDQFVEQDGKDAKTIHDSEKSKTTVASILSHRVKERRFAINVKMATYSADHKTPWFPDTYEVGNNPFDDCCFSLIQPEATVLGNYMKYYIGNLDKQRIGFAMALTKNTKDLITTFNSHNKKQFDDYRKDLEDPYKLLVKSWANQNRESLETGELNHDSVTADANTLNTEHKNNGWKSIRTQLDCIFFQKSIKYAKVVVAEFEKLNNNKAIEDIISNYGLDEGLASTYLVFAKYIKNKHKFIAEILHTYSDGSEWGVWTMCMAVIHLNEWAEVNEAFKKISNNTPLTKFITGRNIDKVMADMMALIIDPSFKSTQF